MKITDIFNCDKYDVIAESKKIANDFSELFYESDGFKDIYEEGFTDGVRWLLDEIIKS